MQVSLLLKKKLGAVAIAASIATAACIAAGFNWRWAWVSDNFIPMLLAYTITAAFAVAPYGLYLLCSPQVRAGAKLQFALLGLLIAISASLHGYCLLTDAQTNGWNYLIVPFLQLVYLFLAIPVTDRLAAIARRVRPADYGT